MRTISAQEIEAALGFDTLIPAIADAFRAGITVPMRHHHTIPQEGRDATLLLMPAWMDKGGQNLHSESTRYCGCKIVSVFPDNTLEGKPSVYGSYLLMDGTTGLPLAVMEGAALTAWRTAAASALVAKYLAREDASHLVMIGAGTLAPRLVRAHCSVRPIKRVTLWNRTRGRAETLAAELELPGVAVTVTDNLEQAVRAADIVSCATLSLEPLVRGAWLKAGAHLDLVGAFRPNMREADDDAIRRSRVYVDTIAGATKEGGDIVQPLASGSLKTDQIAGDLFGLTRGMVKGRASADEITLFKSVGTAIEDLAAAMLVWRRLAG
jgi:ornithine cyclodeaminase